MFSNMLLGVHNLLLSGSKCYYNYFSKVIITVQEKYIVFIPLVN